MSSNSMNKQTAVQATEEMVEHARARARGRRIIKARELAAQYKPQMDGSILIQRFNLRERIQHFVLIFSFSTLGFTGLMQTFSGWFPIAWVINTLFGGIDTLRVIHHLAALVFIIQTVLHGFDILTFWFVKKEMGSMIPAWKDVTDLLGMLKYNLGLAKSRPAFDRFSVEEKVEYWALWWGAIIMSLTGIFQWYPSLVTQILPGVVIPMARLIHMLEAILAVLAILIWHLYHTMIKERNLSIFSGHMTDHEMEESHPVEYHRILKAVEFVRDLKIRQSTPAKARKPKKEEPAVKETEEPVAPEIEPAVQIDEAAVEQPVE